MAARKKSSAARKPAVQRHQGHGQHPSFDLPNPVDVAKSVGRGVRGVYRATNKVAKAIDRPVRSVNKFLLGDYKKDGILRGAAQTASWVVPYEKILPVANVIKGPKGASVVAKTVRGGAKVVRGTAKAGLLYGASQAYDSAASRAAQLAEKKKPRISSAKKSTKKKVK